MTEQKSLFLDTDFEEVQITPQPVTCLGMTFESDEARRAYFRKELRKKLPELRKIEGFPIGEDDDIINLSDPPYYTACPNPWLNDFIEQWEMEKVQLAECGKRNEKLKVMQPYAADVSEGKNNPVYTAHTYHTKVPHPAIMRYILHYTQPGDIVFDGFAGTGMTGVAAGACANDNDEIASRINAEWITQFGHKPNWGLRHAIIGDLSPYASNIAYFYNNPVDVKLLKHEVERIKKEMEEECGWMYRTTNSKGVPVGKISFVNWSDVMVCPSCGKEYVFWDQAIDKNNKCVRDEFMCPHCGSIQTKKTANYAVESYYDKVLARSVQRIKQVPVIIVAKSGGEIIKRAPNEYDIKIIKKIENEYINNFYPTYKLPEGAKTKDPKAKLVYYSHQFFTRRNLIALSRLYEKITMSRFSLQLRFMFTGMLTLSSKMNRVRISNYFNRGKGHLSGTLYIPSLSVETSVLDQIEERFNMIEKAYNILPMHRTNAQYVNSADTLLLADDSVDYIFTDPPFGSNLSYSELNSFSEPWLKVMTNNAHEAIENKAQGKDATFYREMMTKCFAEYSRVLKSGKYMTVEFSNTSAAVWNSIQTALQNVGFVIVNVAALDKKQGSFNAVTSTTAVKQDLVITCYKPKTTIHEVTNACVTAENSIWSFIDDYLQHLPVHIVKGNSTTAVVERNAKILYDRLIAYYVQHGYAVPIDAIEFQKGLKERFIERDGMYFTASQALEYEEKRAKSDGFVPMALFIGSEADGIEWLKRKLETPKTYQELQPDWMKDLVAPKKGDVLPGLDVILEENFIKGDDGKWNKPDPENASHLEQLRGKRMMKEFNIYLEAAKKPKAKRMKDTRLEVLRYGFKDCYKQKNYQDIVTVGEHIPESLLMEDEILLQYYDIAVSRI